MGAAGSQVVDKLETTQNRVRAATEALTGKGAGTDSDYALTDERFEGLTAQQLYESVHGPGGMDVTGLETIRMVWNSAATDLGAVSVGMQTRVLALLNAGALTGQAGDAAAAAAARLGQAANQVAEVFSAGDQTQTTSAATTPGALATTSAPGIGPSDSQLYVLSGRSEGYVPAYDDYAADVAGGRAPR